ncbi:3-phosphoshikimate 1-carboxyvinyltransferase [Roseiterribacter gracilis]|uniref:3-phosphoshikimate 1-carboxyvinyltransferase n=1 Tax=Roseiterribacter gracilis TaxID=2812848 RepID=A0A8S8XB59_9PROT|nr:3-phosphoshikimate 1-carboxyvinyltransferase [Rhodospirillales bacterium TMPK1]
MSTQKPIKLTGSRARPLTGLARVAGDKSISHRSVMLGAVAVGRTQVEGLLEGDDVLATAAACRLLGARVEQLGPGRWQIDGVGLGGLAAPDQVLDMGNSGTAARLLLGLLATHELSATMTGDASLVKRPMGRVIEPLSRMGAKFTARDGNKLPLTIEGAVLPVPLVYELPVASAQVKSAVLLAGLNAPGATSVIEREPTRDHTERMLGHFGADMRVEDIGNGKLQATVVGRPELIAPKDPIRVPADPSSAAFPCVAALLIEGSEIKLPDVGTNPRRTGLYETLREMGADLRFENEREEGGEPVADLVVRASELKAVDVPASRAPSMIDEYPILAVAAACARGTTTMRGLAELRVKESDRLAMIANGLAACGVRVESGDDWLSITGDGRPPAGGTTVATAFDHRIAMSFLVLGQVSAQPIAVDDAAAIATSFPDFVALMNRLGGSIS